MYTYIYIYTTILDVRGFDSSTILKLRGRTSHVRRESPGKFESTNLSRDNLSRETGRDRTYIYIYIYIYRERERDIHTCVSISIIYIYIYIYMYI